MRIHTLIAIMNAICMNTHNIQRMDEQLIKTYEKRLNVNRVKFFEKYTYKTLMFLKTQLFFCHHCEMSTEVRLRIVDSSTFVYWRNIFPVLRQSI